MRPLFTFALVIVALILGGPAVVPARNTMSNADFVTPDPAECQLKPRTMESIITVHTTSIEKAPVINTPAAQGPIGEAVDEETRETITAVVRQAAACANAGDFLRGLALYTDNGVRTLLAGQAPTADELVKFYGGSPVPLPADTQVSFRVRSLRELVEGQVTAFVDFRDSAGTTTVFLTLVRQGDRYLIDSQVAVWTDAPTPTPELSGTSILRQ